MRRISRSILLAAVLLMVLSTGGFTQTRLYLAEYEFNNPKLKSMNLDGTDLQEPFAPPSGEWLLVGLDFYQHSGRLYWTHGSTPGTIRRAFFDGTGEQLIASGLKLPRGLALDRYRGKVYWTAAPPEGNALGLIQRVNMDGTELETLYTLDPYDPVWSYVGPPTVDPTNGYVYFCAENEIQRKRTDGTGAVETVVRGVTTVKGIDLDIANNHIYFLDANTNSDYLGRCNLDDTGFTVLVDMSPAENVSSGLWDLLVDPSGGKAYWVDELAHHTQRCDLDGTNVETIYNSPASLYPTGLAFNVDIFPPIADCNGNEVPDRDDIDSEFSDDCNGNGIPDECEDDPCAPEVYLVDHGSDPESSGRSVSGDPATGYEVFQPFDLTEEKTLRRIDLDGWTVNYHLQGFSATILPDDGTGTFPDEAAPIETIDFQWRFSGTTTVWVGRTYTATLGAGRYWIRLTASDPDYDAVAHVGVSGLPSLSRRNSDGEVFEASRSIALRVVADDAASIQEPPVLGAAAVVSAKPNPFHATSQLNFNLPRKGAVRLTIHDPAGRVVRTLVDATLQAGGQAVLWDGTDDAGRPVASGIYYSIVQAGTTRLSGTVTRLR
jgi:hypothetical protein